MGREVRRVPADWQHPKNEKGNYIPLMGGSYSKRAAEWDEGESQWNAGFCAKTVWHDGGGYHDEWEPKGADRDYPYSEWTGVRPLAEDYMPDWPDEQRTHLQMYKDTSGGTPISPVMETPEELARWLADNAASAFAGMTATYDQWLATINRGSAVSAVMTVYSDGTGTMQSGVEALRSPNNPTDPRGPQMKQLAGCLLSQCPGVHDLRDGSGDLLVIGKNAVFSEAYMNSDISAGRDEVALTISRDTLVGITACPSCGKPKLVRNGELIQCRDCGHVADEIPSVTNKRLAKAMELILPMAKAYAHANNVGNNLAFIRSAEEALIACKT